MEKYSLSVLWFCSSFLAFSNPKDPTSSTTKSMTLFFHYLHQIFGPGPKLAFFFLSPIIVTGKIDGIITCWQVILIYNLMRARSITHRYAVNWAQYYLQHTHFPVSGFFTIITTTSLFEDKFSSKLLCLLNHWVSPSLSSNNKEHNECIKSQKGIL